MSPKTETPPRGVGRRGSCAVVCEATNRKIADTLLPFKNIVAFFATIDPAIGAALFWRALR